MEFLTCENITCVHGVRLVGLYKSHDKFHARNRSFSIAKRLYNRKLAVSQLLSFPRMQRTLPLTDWILRLTWGLYEMGADDMPIRFLDMVHTKACPVCSVILDYG